MDKHYKPVIADRYTDDYFMARHENCEKRLEQFKIDGDFLKKYKQSGIICDVGCSTGEFLKSIAWEGQTYGMEINLKAKQEAEKNGFKFDKNILNQVDFFDAVIFRGTIQHVDEPFRMIKAAYKSLKKDGVIVFLATPNSDSILYRLKLNLPFLDPNLNFYIPGLKSLSNALENYGFEVLASNLPYWHTPYRNFPRDIFYFAMNVFTRRFYKHAFWGSSMSLVARK